MAGFNNNASFNNMTTPSSGWNIPKVLKRISKFGMNWEDEVIKQSRSIGVTEADVGNQGFMPEDFLYSLAMADIGQKKFIAYFDKEYKQKKEYLRRFAMNGEIEFMVETISDESIVLDDKNLFCKPDVSILKRVIKEDKKDDIIKYIFDSFQRIYNAHKFNFGHESWNYFKQFLIDGILAFEIIYSEDGGNIIGFKEIDPASIRPGVVKGEDDKYRKVWIQYEDIPTMKREFLDEQIIYISYAKGNFISRVSYVERLIRSFNLLRILENSRIIWNIMNSSFRLKMVVPIGTKSPQKAKESLAEMISMYKEDISLDFDSGELSVNGRPSMQFYKNYLYPSKQGESIEIDTLDSSGPNLSDTEALQYFYDKLKQDSKIPFERFDKQGMGGTFSIGAEGMNREEIRFSKFITRLRSIFQEILLKPLILQICLKYPELSKDELFKSSIGLHYNEENVFEEMKHQEIMEKRVNFVEAMLGLMVPDKDEDGMPIDVSFFDPRFLAEKYLKMTQQDLDLNDEYVRRRKLGLDPKTGEPVNNKKDGENDGDENKPDTSDDFDW